MYGFVGMKFLLYDDQMTCIKDEVFLSRSSLMLELIVLMTRVTKKETVRAFICPCLCINIVNDCVGQRSQLLLYFFFLYFLSKKLNTKIFNFFLLFISH